MQLTDLHASDSLAIRAAERSMGAVLIDAARITPEQVQQILGLQAELGLRFGEAAIQLGYLTPADIDYALSRQFDYAYLKRGESALSETLIAAYDPFIPRVEALRALRAQLMLRWFNDAARKVLAVVSPASGEGRSYVAANLAIVFSQLGQRTLLIDADLRNPSQHRLFGLENRYGLSAVLSGRASTETIHRIPALLDLSVLPAGVVPPNPQELLARPAFAQVLAQLGAHYDVILLDTAPAADTADAQTVAARAGAALIIAKKNRSSTAQVRAAAHSLAAGKTEVLGAVLNEF
jgi:receptor protein-tyrosine kinase